MPTLNNQVIQAAIEGLESRKSAIDEQIAGVRELLDGGNAKPASTPTQSGSSRQISAAARKRMSDAQRRRWAAVKSASASQTPTPAASKKAKRRLSREGRRRIIEATKKRWAAVRAAAAKREK